MMRALLGMGVLMLAAAGPAMAAQAEDPVIAQVLQRDDELSAAHGRGDMATYRAGLSEHYAYIDIGGMRVTADMLEDRREHDLRRLVSSETSEQEAIRLTEDTVLLRGVEHSVSSYFGGLPRTGASRWTALWVREQDGVWRLTAETATPMQTSPTLSFLPAPQSEATLQALAGRWMLQLKPPMDLTLTVENGKLVGKLAGQEARFVFAPASATHYFAEERPFELRFAPDGKSLSLVTWGTPTAATRTGP